MLCYRQKVCSFGKFCFCIPVHVVLHRVTIFSVGNRLCVVGQIDIPFLQIFSGKFSEGKIKNKSKKEQNLRSVVSWQGHQNIA